jgi:hypothetical protein
VSRIPRLEAVGVAKSSSRRTEESRELKSVDGDQCLGSRQSKELDCAKKYSVCDSTFAAV